VVKRYNSIIILTSLFIGLIHGVVISLSFYIFFSWILVGFWLMFTIKIIKNTKRYREFNSPHNTFFFVVLPLFFGIFYIMWGSLSGLFTTEETIYISWWGILFGLPYIFYGLIKLFQCFNKYNVIYFGTKSIKARIVAFFISFIIILTIIIFWVFIYFDLILFILLIITFIINVYSIAGRSQTLPNLTRDYVSRRSSRIENLTNPQLARPSSQTRTTSRTSTSRIYRTTPTARSQTTRVSSKVSTRTINTSKTKPRSVKIKNISMYKPKAAILSSDDFKCIFCFQLPKLPQDNGRGIILCPKCRYPAHADEFRDWLRSSNLCSRCNAPIPSSFQRNPKILSVKNYLIVYKDFLQRRKNSN